MAWQRSERLRDFVSALSTKLSRIKVLHKSQESILVGLWHLEKFETEPIARGPSHLGDLDANRMMMRQQHCKRTYSSGIRHRDDSIAQPGSDRSSTSPSSKYQSV
jgi:hypothetical protein